MYNTDPWEMLPGVDGVNCPHKRYPAGWCKVEEFETIKFGGPMTNAFPPPMEKCIALYRLSALGWQVLSSITLDPTNLKADAAQKADLLIEYAHKLFGENP